MAITLSTNLRNARLTAIVTEAGENAVIKLYTAAYATLLGTLTCGTTLGTVSGGVLTFGVITEDSQADAGGTFALAKLFKSDGTTEVLSGLTVGTSGTNIITSTADCTLNTPIYMTTATITEGNA